MRDCADRLTTVEYDTKRMIICPIRAVDQYIAVGTALGWNMTQGYLFPRISPRPNTGTPIRGKTPISAPDMTKALKVHARNAGERTASTMRSRSTIEGGAGMSQFCPRFGRDGTKIAPPGDIFGQPPGKMS